MPSGDRSAASALKSLQLDFSEQNDSSKISWDTTPMSETMWLVALPRLLRQTKPIRELFEFGWVLVQSKTAVQSALHARYLSKYPDVSFEWTHPAPPFSIAAYEARRSQMISENDRWYALNGDVAPEDAEPPHHLASYILIKDRPDDYDPNTIAETATELGLSDAAELTDAEKLRFVISPEVLTGADRDAGVAIANTISDSTFAERLLARYGRSGRTLMRREYANCRKDLSDGASSYIHEVADLLLRSNTGDISVSQYNRISGTYLSLCRAVPRPLGRTEAFMAEALAAAVKQSSPEVRSALDLEIAVTRAKRSLWKTELAIRKVLGDFQLEAARAAVHAGHGHAFAAFGRDPKKSGETKGPLPRLEGVHGQLPPLQQTWPP
jgi:hypothetical protein